MFFIIEMFDVFIMGGKMKICICRMYIFEVIEIILIKMKMLDKCYYILYYSL